MKLVLKYTSLIMICFMVVLSVSSSFVATESETTLSVSNTSGNRGETVKTSVSVTRNSNIQALTFDLNYDASVLEVVSANYGSVISVGQTVINTSNNGVVKCSYVSSNKAVTGSGELLNVTFRIKPNANYGNSSVNLNVIEMSDGGFNPIDYSIVNGRVTVIAPKLDAPENVHLIETYSDALEIDWDYVSGATGYNVYINGVRHNSEPIENAWYIATGLEDNTQYSVQVSALNYTTESEYSYPTSFQTEKMRYSVAFLDKDFKLIKESVVDKGESVIPPIPPEINNKIFTCWRIFDFNEDKNKEFNDFSSINKDMILYAYYKDVTPQILGDSDGSGDIEIVDSTFIQRYIAKVDTPFTKDELMRGDVDGSGDLELPDATAIQYYLSNMKTTYKIGEPITSTD